MATRFHNIARLVSSTRFWPIYVNIGRPPSATPSAIEAWHQTIVSLLFKLLFIIFYYNNTRVFLFSYNFSTNIFVVNSIWSGHTVKRNVRFLMYDFCEMNTVIRDMLWCLAWWVTITYICVYKYKLEQFLSRYFSQNAFETMAFVVVSLLNNGRQFDKKKIFRHENYLYY